MQEIQFHKSDGSRFLATVMYPRKQVTMATAVFGRISRGRIVQSPDRKEAGKC